MIRTALLLLLFFPVLSSFAQHSRLDSLCRLCDNAATDEEKVTALNNLSGYYTSKKLSRQADSVLEVQLRIAELSDNNKLTLKTYFDNTLADIPTWSSAEDFDRVIRFLKRGIDYANSIGNNEHIVIGYTRLASIYRKKGEFADAVGLATVATNYIPEITSDSLKAIVYIELGDCYQAKGESVWACKSYNNAFDIAIKSKNFVLESKVYHRLSDLFKSLGDLSESKFHLIKSVNLNKKHKQGESLIRDYINLARLTEDPFYINEVLKLSDSLHIDNYRTRAKDILLAIYMVREANSEKALKYLSANPELKESYMKGGIENYHLLIAEIYRYGKNPDSALKYFKMAEGPLLKNYDITKSKRNLFSEMAICYEMKNDRDNAILYYEKALAYSMELRDLGPIASISGSLSSLYKEAGDYKTAIYHTELNSKTRDTLAELAKKKDVTLLSVDREKKQHDELVRQKKVALENKHNMQYMGITISIFLIFLGMLVLGMFEISKTTIRILGYFFFICVFEFIILFLDNTVLHSITHGEPLKLWLIKIGLIGMLVPLQHFLEHRLTHFLQSRKLLQARTNFSMKKFFSKKQSAEGGVAQTPSAIPIPAPDPVPVPAPQRNSAIEIMESDTAVL